MLPEATGVRLNSSNTSSSGCLNAASMVRLHEQAARRLTREHMQRACVRAFVCVRPQAWLYTKDTTWPDKTGVH